MKHTDKALAITLSIVAGLALVACGNNGDYKTKSSDIATGYYVDSAVMGVGYRCGTQTGTTDKDGKFRFERGQDCSFHAGNVVLRNVDSSSLSDKITILEDNANTTQFLQSMDEDGDATNGIELSSEVTSIIDEEGMTTVPKDDLKINNLVTKIKNKHSNYKGRFVSKEEAYSHVQNTRDTINSSGVSYSDNTGNHSGNGNTNYNNQSGNTNMGSNTNYNNQSGNTNMGSSTNYNDHSGNSNMGSNTNYNNQSGNSNMGSNTNMNNISSSNSNTLKDFNYISFSKSLAIPALAKYSVDSDGYKVFALDIDEGTTEFFDGVKTDTYGINAAVLGETIRMHDGDKIKLQYTNNLAFATTMHGHGMHVPAIMDGGPINKIQPNQTWTAQYTVNQKAATNWYHPHLMGKTAEHVYMGLAGFIIVDDDESDALNLPKEYGVDDIPLAIQDKRFDSNGQIDYSPDSMEIRMGYKADVMLVNGVILPYEEVPTKKVRFRVLNGSNGSIYKLKFSDNREFEQIAVDNSFLEHPVTLNSVTLTPGERAEIVVDFTNEKGKKLTLVDSNSGIDVMEIRVTKDAKTVSEVPATLTTLDKLDSSAAVRTRKFELSMAQGDDGAMHMAINGKIMDMNRIDEYVPKDDIEVWEITNKMGMTHNFHIHATHFFPLSRNGSAVPANEQGYKDVISMPGYSTVKIVVKMTDYVNEKTGYMYHCHFLEHEDDGMMGQFAVTDGKADVNVRP